MGRGLIPATVSKKKVNNSLNNISIKPSYTQTLHNISLNPDYLVDFIHDFSDEDTLGVYSHSNIPSLRLLQRARNVLKDGFSSVEIDNGKIHASQNIFKYDIFEYRLSINKGDYKNGFR